MSESSFVNGPLADERDEEIQRLREALEAKTRELEAQQDRYVRAVAEFDNVRKRNARERDEYTRYANESVLRDLLPVLDNLDRALQAARAEPTAAVTAWPMRALSPEPRTSRLRTRRARRGSGSCHVRCDSVVLI